MIHLKDKIDNIEVIQGDLTSMNLDIIVNAATCNSPPPALAFGYSKLSIGCANMHIPIVHGSPINIDTNNENEVLLVAVSMSFFAFASAIAGTNAVANAMFTDNGNPISVSTFPLNIPYFSIAISAGKYVDKILFTVNASTFLFIEDSTELIVIGIDTISTFFTILNTLSYL